MRDKIVALANAEIGTKEGSTRHKEYIDNYNTITPLPASYKMTYTASWCMTFITWLFYKLGILSLISGGECSCGRMIALAIANGTWVESDSYTPKPGDVIMYDWDDSGTGDCTGWPDHVGIIVKISGSVMTVVEGNKSDMVTTRSMSVNGKYIRGYIVPKYTEEAASESVTTTTESDAISEDGEWGCYTTTKTQEVVGTTADGLVSNQLESCKKYLPNALTSSWEFGPKGTGYSPMIKRVQALIGVPEKEQDGWAGEDFVKYLQTFLNEKMDAGLKVDGEMGALTVTEWQKWLNAQ